MITIREEYDPNKYLVGLEHFTYIVTFKDEEGGRKEDGPRVIAASDEQEVYSSGLQMFSTLEAIFTHQDKSGEEQWPFPGSLAFLKENSLLEEIGINIYNAKYNISFTAYFGDTFEQIGNKQ